MSYNYSHNVSRWFDQRMKCIYLHAHNIISIICSSMVARGNMSMDNTCGKSMHELFGSNLFLIFQGPKVKLLVVQMCC
jgi:hypothetical protein